MCAYSTLQLTEVLNRVIRSLGFCGLSRNYYVTLGVVGNDSFAGGSKDWGATTVTLEHRCIQGGK